MFIDNCPYFEDNREDIENINSMRAMPYANMSWCNQQPMYNPYMATPPSPMQNMPMSDSNISKTIENVPDNTTENISSMQPPTPNMLNISAQPSSPVQDDINYNQGFLKTQIGKRIKVEFLIGTNMLIDREGTLVGVGISYILIDEVDTRHLIMADMYSIKFVTIFD